MSKDCFFFLAKNSFIFLSHSIEIFSYSDFTIAFDTDNKVKVQFGAREDAKGKWKIIQGELDGATFTLSVNEFGNYTVVTNKGQAKKNN